jgi:hypothetical protein
MKLSTRTAIQQRRFRIALAVVFVLTLLASIHALQSPAGSVVEVIERAQNSHRQHGLQQSSSASKAVSTTITAKQSKVMPAKPLLAVAQKDPFYLAASPAPKVEVPPPPPVVALAPPPAPVAPPFNYQLFGRVRAPNGTDAVYLSSQDQLIAVGEGVNLNDGYQVEKISSTEIVIKHSATGQEVRIALPTES